MNYFSPIILIALVGASGSQIYRDVVPLPDRKTHNDTCMASAIKTFGTYYEQFGWHWNSTIDRSLGQAFCTCEYEKMRHRPLITKVISQQAMEECWREFDPNRKAFLRRYLIGK